MSFVVTRETFEFWSAGREAEAAFAMLMSCFELAICTMVLTMSESVGIRICLWCRRNPLAGGGESLALTVAYFLLPLLLGLRDNPALPQTEIRSESELGGEIDSNEFGITRKELPCVESRPEMISKGRRRI